MTAGEVLAARRTAIVAAWLADTLNRYPAGTRHLLTAPSDRFRNPAGHILHEALPALFDAVAGGNWAQAPGPLGELVQLRAVQGFSREEAVEFVARLKDVVTEVAGPTFAAPVDLRAATARPRQSSPESQASGGGKPGADARPCSVGPELEIGACDRDLDARIDRLSAMALETYDACRARIDAIRANETRRRTWVLERIGAAAESGRHA